MVILMIDDRKNLGQNIKMDFLKMSREIASGMEYLAGMSFVHRVSVSLYIMVSLPNSLYSFHGRISRLETCCWTVI